MRVAAYVRLVTEFMQLKSLFQGMFAALLTCMHACVSSQLSISLAGRDCNIITIKFADRCISLLAKFLPPSADELQGSDEAASR